MIYGIQRIYYAIDDFLNMSDTEWDDLPLSKKAVYFIIAILMPIVGSIVVQ